MAYHSCDQLQGGYLSAYENGKKNNSLAPIASGKHLQTDTYSTLGIIIGLAVIDTIDPETGLARWGDRYYFRFYHHTYRLSYFAALPGRYYG